MRIVAGVLYTDPKKKRPLHIYVNFLQKIAVFSFS